MEKADKLLQRLPLLEVVQLREQWFLHYHGDARLTMSARLLRLAIAFKVQELEQDAVGRCAAIRKKAAEYRLANEDLGQGRMQFLKPGTRLLREYKGTVHEVLAIENGRFVYVGQICNSLSEAARKITGSPRCGTVFFGLKGKPWRGFDG